MGHIAMVLMGAAMLAGSAFVLFGEPEKSHAVIPEQLPAQTVSLWEEIEENGRAEIAVNTPGKKEARNTQDFQHSKHTENVKPTAEQSIPGNNEVLSASGYVIARRIATVSAQIKGLIDTVDVEEGMVVQQGQILARVDSVLARVDLQLYKAQVVAKKASVEGVQADLSEAELELRRLERLDDYASKAQLTRSRANLAKLRASHGNAKAELRVAELQVTRQQELLENHVIRAPFAGVVTVKNAQLGEIVSPDSAGGGFTRTGICTLVDMDSLEIEVDVNEAYIRRVFPGQKVVAKLDAYPDWDIPASVIAIIPTADRSKATMRVRIRLEEKDARMLPDMSVKVGFYT